MVRTIVKIRFQLYHGVSVLALGHGFAKAFFHSREIFLGNCAADHGNLESQPFLGAGRKPDAHISVLSRTAVLLFVFALHIHPFGNALPIGNARYGQFDIDAETGLEARGQHGQVRIAQTRNEHLRSFRVIFIAERQILIQHPGNTLRHLAFVRRALRQNDLCHIGHGITDLPVSECAGFRERIIGFGGGKFGDHADVAAGKFFGLFLFFAHHGVKMRHFFTTAAAVLQRHIPTQSTAHDLEIGHLTHKRVGHGLENEERGFAGRIDFDFSAVFQRFFFLGGKAREGFGHCVQHGDYAPHFGGRATVDRLDTAGNNTLMQCQRRFLAGDLFAGKIFFHERLIRGGNGLIEIILIVCRQRTHLRIHGNLAAAAVLRIGIRLHIHQVDHGGVVPFPIRNENRADIVAETLAQLGKRLGKIIVWIVALIDKKYFRYAGLCGGVKRQFRADLNAALTVHHNDGTARHTERLTDLALKIGITRRIQNVDFNIFINKRSQRGGNRKAALLFFRVKIANRVSVRDLSHAVGSSAQVKHCFDQRGLPARAVSQQCQVPNCFCVECSHRISSFVALGVLNGLPASIQAGRPAGFRHPVFIISYVCSLFKMIIGNSERQNGETARLLLDKLHKNCLPGTSKVPDRQLTRAPKESNSPFRVRPRKGWKRFERCAAPSLPSCIRKLRQVRRAYRKDSPND